MGVGSGPTAGRGDCVREKWSESILKLTGTTKGEYKCNETDVFRLITPRWKCLLSILPENG